MKLQLSILSLLFFLNTSGQSRENIKQAQQKILSADSIVLISHVLTKEFAPKITEDWDKTKKRPPAKETFYPKYLKKGKINQAIIKQRKRILKTEVAEISNIFKYEIAEEKNQVKCDWPHHSILIYKNKSLSYIDLCLDCKQINTSKDIALSEADLTDNKWENLKLFFKKHGLTYELN
jgi:hypothetical protein